EFRALSRLVREMMALAGLRASWVGQEPHQIAQGFAEALLSAMNLRFVYLRCSTASIEPVEVTRAAEPSQESEVRRLVERVLSSRVGDSGRTQLHVPAPDDNRPLTLSIHPLGSDGELGSLVMASERVNFPNEYDRSLIAIGTLELT